MPDYLAVGTRVRLTHAVDRYPHFIAPEGATGTLRMSGPSIVAVQLDKYLPGAEAWDNEVCWYPENGDFPEDDIEVLPVQADVVLDDGTQVDFKTYSDGDTTWEVEAI